MKHVKLMAVKFVLCLALLFVILGLGYGMSFGNVFLITLVLGVLSYVVGDLMILPRTNNTIATGSDFVLAFVVIYFMSDALTAGGELFTATLITSVGVAIFEYFFHKYVASNISSEPREMKSGAMNLSTEASEEIFPYDREEEAEDENK
ncbi:YndM family protein [Halobacillus seohaensis]|uniref:YndM family protein n=1 Tax=Halobacillus seohaensis TaxID=447421 RepID=A0ABW2ELX9_9BACI